MIPGLDEAMKLVRELIQEIRMLRIALEVANERTAPNPAFPKAVEKS